MIGLIVGAGPLAGTIGGFFGGALSDRWKFTASFYHNGNCFNFPGSALWTGLHRNICGGPILEHNLLTASGSEKILPR
ncbi:hypothetical protein B7C51_17830 [Paenibacillus larvae subsp. pulvifaciens]|uniref:Uncharacterized protein n=1 Tax=Paenibacillus larvae subsp. pulvifaciens TaxID=1477 RepID=A0A1V0UW47_9BACL|nr:hypothetical protein B7C51_17830 [Paenibacillus larvae subsp. pulvifaciens]